MCDFEALNYNLKDELLNLYKEADTPKPRVKINKLKKRQAVRLGELGKAYTLL